MTTPTTEPTKPTCDHVFRDTKHCVKCGWTPTEADMPKPPASDREWKRCLSKIILARGAPGRGAPDAALTDSEITLGLQCHLPDLHDGLHVHSGRGLPITEGHRGPDPPFVQDDSIYAITWRAFM